MCVLCRYMSQDMLHDYMCVLRRYMSQNMLHDYMCVRHRYMSQDMLHAYEENFDMAPSCMTHYIVCVYIYIFH